MKLLDIASLVISIVGTASGIAGLILTAFTFNKTKTIDKAITEKKEEIVNKVKYVDNYKYYLNALERIYIKLTSSRKIPLSSDNLKELSIQIEDILKWLNGCNAHYKDEDKKKTTEHLNKLKEKNQNVDLCFDGAEREFLREATSDIIHMLKKEDYII